MGTSEAGNKHSTKAQKELFQFQIATVHKKLGASAEQSPIL